MYSMNEFMAQLFKKRREDNSFPAVAFKLGRAWHTHIWIQELDSSGQFIGSLGIFHPLFLRHRFITAVSSISTGHTEHC